MKNKNKYYKSIFYLLSIFSGFLETGIIFWGVMKGFSCLQVILLGLFFQIGQLIPSPIKFNKSTTFGISAFSFLCIVFSYLFINNNDLLFILLLFSIFFTIAIIQSLRSFYLSKASVFYKRLCRMTGYILSPFYLINIHIFISITLIIILIFTKWDVKTFKIFKIKWSGMCNLIFLHQAHYFCYLYFFLFQIASLLFKKNIQFAGLIYVLGWIFYALAPRIIKKTSSYAKNFIISHLLLSLVILAMGIFFNDLGFLILFWILTSLFSCSVFFLGKINALVKESDWISRDFSEILGHIFGTILGLIVYLLFSYLPIAIYASAFIAFATGLYMIKYKRKYVAFDI